PDTAIAGRKHRAPGKPDKSHHGGGGENCYGYSRAWRVVPACRCARDFATRAPALAAAGPMAGQPAPADRTRAVQAKEAEPLPRAAQVRSAGRTDANATTGTSRYSRESTQRPAP